MFKENRSRTVFILFFIIIAIRFINITMPILEGTAMRQAQTASITRNFYKEGINMLYPKADHFGKGPGYLVLEFPLLNVLAASGYMILSGVQEWVGRFFSIFFFACAAYFLYAITKRLFTKEVAFWSLAVFGFSPLSIIFSRAFMPDFEMLFFSLGALCFLYEFCMTEKVLKFWASAVFLSLALLVKPHSFYIFIPLLYLIYRKENWKFIINWRNWAYILIAFVPAILWYLHGSAVHAIFTQEQSFNYQLSNWFDPTKLLNLGFYTNLLKIYGGIMLTPIGLILCIAGLSVKVQKEQSLVWAWLIGGIIFLFGFITHMWEPYYHLNILPICAIFAGRGIVFLRYMILEKRSSIYRWITAILILVSVPLWLRYTAYAYVVPKGYRYVVETGKRIQELTDKDDLIIASAAGGPQSLYFCDRKGWQFLLSVDSNNAIERLEELRAKGAKYFVAAVMEDFNNNRVFKEYMLENYKLIDRKEDKYIIFFLRDRS